MASLAFRHWVYRIGANDAIPGCCAITICELGALLDLGDCDAAARMLSVAAVVTVVPLTATSAPGVVATGTTPGVVATGAARHREPRRR